MRKILVISLVFCMLALSINIAAGEDKEESFPSTYDLRTLGYVPAVMNQGTDQTCWTFAAMAAMKSNYLMYADKNNHGKYLGSNSDLSQLHLAWYSFKNPDKKQNFAFIKNNSVVENPANTDILNHPGNPQMALSFLSRNDGPIRETDLPYSGAYPVAGTSPRDYKQALRIKNATYIESLSSDKMVIINKEQMIKINLMSLGAVDTGVYWDKNYVSSKAAYYNPSSRRGSHAVTIIGWDDNYSRENFSPIKPAGNGAWLVQNSWGTEWGDNGYFWMSYSQDIRYAMAFETEAPNPRVREYLHDDLGFTHEVTLTDESGEIVQSPSIVNVFKVKGDHETLREVGYYSTNSEAIGLLTVLDLGTENSPENVKAAMKDPDKIQSILPIISVANKGYTTSPLPIVVPLSKDHYFAIFMAFTSFAGEEGEEMDSEIGNFSNFTPSIAAEVKIPGYRTAYAEIGANETYYSLSSTDVYHDAKDYTFLVGDQEVTGFNACIKGFTYTPDERLPDDWTIISADGKAQLSISLLRETEPKYVSVKGQGIENVLHKIELEDSDTGGVKGNFYTLKLICDVTADNAKITSLIIDGKETITGNLDKMFANKMFANYDTDEDDGEVSAYVDISKVGVSLSLMNLSESTVIDSTDSYEENNYTPSEKEAESNQNTTTKTPASGGGGGGGCNMNFVAALMAIIFCVKFMRAN